MHSRIALLRAGPVPFKTNAYDCRHTPPAIVSSSATRLSPGTCFLVFLGEGGKERENERGGGDDGNGEGGGVLAAFTEASSCAQYCDESSTHVTSKSL